MSYARPTFTALQSRIAADLAALPEVLRVPLAAAWAKACNGQHGYLEWIDAQCSPLTCEEERLSDWAVLYNVPRLLATSATGFTLATGTSGTQILKDTFLRGQNGLDYIVTAATTLTAGNTPVALRCTTSGSSGNLDAGLTLALIDPIPGCNSTLVVDAAGLSGGAEAETVESWRARVVSEWQNLITNGARGGKPDDYRYWAKAAHPSVTTALVFPHALGVGTVLVRPICNGLANRLPSPAVLDAVAAYFANSAPATADWRLVAPNPQVVNFTIDLAAGVDTAQNRAAVITALTALVHSETSEAALLQVAEIDAAIATVTMQYTRSVPVSDVAVASGEVLVMGTVSFI